MQCFHCYEPVPAGSQWSLTVKGKEERVCCPGCLAVAQLIQDQGFEQFYDFRTAPANKPRESDDQDAFEVCDRPDVFNKLTRAIDTDTRELRCHIGGISCAACTWLINKGLRNIEGVTDASINPVSGESTIQFNPHLVSASTIFQTIADFGFEPRPVTFAQSNDGQTQRSRADLKRLAVAGLGFAQVMSLSAALYLGAFSAMDARFEQFFIFASLLIATPVVLYAGAPIFSSAWSALSRHGVNMDVPVSLAIAAALGASVFNAFRGSGHIYFDSATMFVFFLTLGRFLETRARNKAGSLFAALGELTPISAHRRSDNTVSKVGTLELNVGDTVVVAPGEALPADGILRTRRATIDESILSGESLGQSKLAGDALLGGSLNSGSEPIDVEITHLGNESYIARVGNLLNAAMADRPNFIGLADRAAAWFVVALLLLTTACGLTWLVVAPERAFEIVLAMLVVTCPCALSLAAPTAFAVALGQFAQRGLLLRSARIIERMGDVHLWMFDKTGTVTEGRMTINHIQTFAKTDSEECLQLAAALEAGIEHPIARAFQCSAAIPAATQVQCVAGEGISGIVNGRSLRLGSAAFTGMQDDSDGCSRLIFLMEGTTPLARFELTDTIRAHARNALQQLASSGMQIALVSGDREANVANTANTLGLAHYYAKQLPEQKLELLQKKQDEGCVVAAVGDGINDAPLLGRADVSIAMVSGSQLAKATADIVFTGSDLRVVAQLPKLCNRVRVVVRQNLMWAACYNLLAIPLAATGLIAPWTAALGMSLSSVMVVLNALRLNRSLNSDVELQEHTNSPRLIAGAQLR